MPLDSTCDLAVEQVFDSEVVLEVTALASVAVAAPVNVAAVADAVAAVDDDDVDDAVVVAVVLDLNFVQVVVDLYHSNHN